MKRLVFIWTILFISGLSYGQELPLEEGIICVKINQKSNNGLFLKYLGDNERTSNSFKHNLYYIGDKAYKDEDGYIWFIGRNDDVIKASVYDRKIL